MLQREPRCAAHVRYEPARCTHQDRDNQHTGRWERVLQSHAPARGCNEHVHAAARGVSLRVHQRSSFAV